jgi:DNA-binding PadR family transcriptional regulator
MGKEVLGELEHQVLLTAVRLAGAAYSAAIVTELEAVTGREVAPAAVYIALRRLEEGGFAASELRPPPADPGGRKRRYFRATRDGLALLAASRRRYLGLWEGIEGTLEEAGG